MTDEPDISLAEQLAYFYDGEDAVKRNTGYIMKAGVEATHDRGVLYKGPWEQYGDGFAEHTRRSARALAMAGVPVHLRSFVPKVRAPAGEEKLIDEKYADLLNASIKTYAAQVLQFVPTDGTLSRYVTHKYHTLEELRYISARKALYTVWERFSGLEEMDVVALKTVGQAWVGCEASATLLKNAGVPEEKVRVVPCPFMPDDPLLLLQERRLAPNHRPTFYHIGKWEPRKEQRNMMGAFLLAFRPGEAGFIVKTSERAPFFQDYPPGPAIALTDWLKDERVKKNGWTAANVQDWLIIMTERLTAERMLNLHQRSDVYVSLSRAEGFNMPAFDAKLAGNLLLFTASGGTEDFASVEDIEVPVTGFVPANAFYRWTAGSTYADFDIEAAVAAFQEAATAARARTKAGLFPGAEFSADAVGKRMAAYIREMADV